MDSRFTRSNWPAGSVRPGHDGDGVQIEAENLPCWMLDTDYNGMVFFASQVFFPKTSAWDNLQKSLKGSSPTAFGSIWPER